MPTATVETVSAKFEDITFVHSLEPKKKNITLFDLSVIPTSEMKACREALPIACSFCNKTRNGLLICAKCKVAAYCSRECQKKNWPSHKLVCMESKAAGNLKLVNTFTANMFMEAFLMATFALAFGLHENMIVDRPLIARCDLAVDAADMSIIFNLTSGKQTPDDYPNGVEGMVQIKSFIPLDSEVAIDARRRKIWEQARMKNHRLQSGPVGKNATVLIDFHMEGTDQVVTTPLSLFDMLLEGTQCMAKGVYIEHPGTGEEFHIPLLPTTSIGPINMHIRDDKKNQLRLRTHMPKEALYKYVGNNINHRHLQMLPTIKHAIRNGKETQMKMRW